MTIVTRRRRNGTPSEMITTRIISKTGVTRKGFQLGGIAGYDEHSARITGEDHTHGENLAQTLSAGRAAYD